MTNYIKSDYHGVKLAFRERQCAAKQPDIHPELLRPRSHKGRQRKRESDGLLSSTFPVRH
jgi:hypothetical protein